VKPPISDRVRAARAQWKWRGQRRPAFAHEPGVGQQSVWDFPRPPLLRTHEGTLEVRRAGAVLARTERGYEVCETAHPPTYYFPPEDVAFEHLRESAGSTFCEWKGAASYFDVLAGSPLARAAWRYREPFAEFLGLRDHLAFMPQGLECFVDGELARPQPGGYYGGWITSRYAGPFKGEPGVGG
jgi:uncharacterized protein (DUF427 family)